MSEATMSREAMSHKELRRVVTETVVTAVIDRLNEKDDGKDWGKQTLMAEFDEVVGDDGRPEVEIRVRDLALPAPEKGERPWHVYRVSVAERQG